MAGPAAGGVLSHCDSAAAFRPGAPHDRMAGSACAPGPERTVSLPSAPARPALLVALLEREGFHDPKWVDLPHRDRVGVERAADLDRRIGVAGQRLQLLLVAGQPVDLALGLDPVHGDDALFDARVADD